MKTLRAMLVRFAGLFRRKQHETEMNEELRAHLDALTERNLAGGMSPDEARFAAQRAFGGVAQIAEHARDERRSPWGDHLLQDLRYATRQIVKRPGFAAVVVLTLAVGIGATTAIGTAINAIMIRPLPVQAPSELVVVELPFIRPGLLEPASRGLYNEFRERATTIGEPFVLGDERIRPFVQSGGGGGEVDFVRVEQVTGNFFVALGVPATVGRTLLPTDDQPGKDAAMVVISYAFWQRRFGSDPAVVGQKVRIEHALFQIVGVAAAGFSGLHPGSKMDVWCPISSNVLLDPKSRVPPEDPNFRVGMIVARLRAGVSREQAQIELDGIFQQNLERLKKGRTTGDAGWRRYFIGRKLALSSAARGINRSHGLRQQISPTLFALGAASAIVLLVGCANVASLLIARGEARYREFAIRAAFGASRRRLFAQLLHESVQLSLAGGLLGMGLAHAGTAWLAGYLPPDGNALDLAPDGRVLAFSVLLATVTGLLSGLTPALRATRVDLTTAFKNQAATIAGGSQRLNSLLVVGQIAMAFMLVVSAGLFGRTLKALLTLDLGFARERLMLMHVSPANTSTGATAAALYWRILKRIESLPGVVSATIASGTFLDNRASQPFSFERQDGADAATVNASGMDVGPRFFTTTGVQLVSGRDFAERDFTGRGPAPLIVSESLARIFFPGVDVVGKQFKRGATTSEIIGVVRDMRFDGFRANTPFGTYAPFMVHYPDEDPRPMIFHVRTTFDPATLASSLREIVRELEPTARITALRTMDAFIDETLLRERALAQVSQFFSGFSLLLACLGLYGFLSFSVQRRTREIGVRVALGAQVRDVVALFLRRGLRLVIIGCLLGFAGVLGGARLIASLLYAVSGSDVFSLLLATAIVVVTGALATWLPARRAAKIDPVETLRAD